MCVVDHQYFGYGEYCCSIYSPMCHCSCRFFSGVFLYSVLNIFCFVSGNGNGYTCLFYAIYCFWYNFCRCCWCWLFVFFLFVSLLLSLSVSFSFYNSYNCNGPFLYHIEQQPGHTPEHFLCSFYDWYSQPHGLRGMFSVQCLVASCVFTRQFFFTLILNVCLVFCVSQFSFLIHTLELTLFRMQ